MSAVRVIGALLALATGFCARAAIGGDSLWGKVVAVKAPDLVTIDIGTGQLDVRIVGIDAPREGRRMEDAKRMVSDLVLGKNARLRLEYRGKNKEYVGRLQTDEGEGVIRDVGLELVRAGMVQRQPRFDYKYRELSGAEDEAKRAKRGMWASGPNAPARTPAPVATPRPEGSK